MNSWILAFSLLFAVCVADDVLTLTADNFDQTISENPLLLVEFYAPWCGHCKRLEPEYEQAATILKEKNLHIAKVDADDSTNAALRDRFDIRGFPTLKLFTNGVPSDYEGDRTADAIVSFMKKQAAPAITELKEAADITKFSGEDRVVIVGFFSDRSSTQYAAFKETAEKNRNSYSFGEVVEASASVLSEFGISSTPAIILFKKFDEGKNVLETSQFTDASALSSFIKTFSVPLFDEIGGHNYKIYVESTVPLLYLFVDLTVDGQKEQFVDNTLLDVAKENRGKVNFIYIDWAKYQKHAERLGLSGKVVPSLVIEKLDEGYHYIYDETKEITKEGVSEFVSKFVKGELSPNIKSEEIPAENSGPVTIVVAKSFDQIVLDSTKDVLVEFYAPWCGHCKKLEPTFNELGTNLKSVGSIVIAKIDATANDIPASYGIQGFPTIKLFPANNKKEPIDYNGDRSLDDLTLFLKSHASVSFGENTGKDEL